MKLNNCHCLPTLVAAHTQHSPIPEYQKNEEKQGRPITREHWDTTKWTSYLGTSHFVHYGEVAQSSDNVLEVGASKLVLSAIEVD